MNLNSSPLYAFCRNRNQDDAFVTIRERKVSKNDAFCLYPFDIVMKLWSIVLQYNAIFFFSLLIKRKFNQRWKRNKDTEKSLSLSHENIWSNHIRNFENVQGTRHWCQHPVH